RPLATVRADGRRRDRRRGSEEAGTRLFREYIASASAFARALRPPALRRVVIAYGLAAGAEAATWLAVRVYAYAPGGATGVGVVGLAILLPSAVMSPIAASMADRHRRQRILFAAYVAQAAGVAAVAVAMRAGAPAPVVYACATVAALAVTPLRPTQGALLRS